MYILSMVPNFRLLFIKGLYELYHVYFYHPKVVKQKKENEKMFATLVVNNQWICAFQHHGQQQMSPSFMVLVLANAFNIFWSELINIIQKEK